MNGQSAFLLLRVQIPAKQSLFTYLCYFIFIFAVSETIWRTAEDVSFHFTK